MDYVCTCAARGCNTQIIANTGKPGRLLNARAHKEHQTYEARQKMVREAENLQAQKLKEQEEDIAGELARLTLAHETSPADPTEATPQMSKTASNYRTNRVKTIINHISAKADEVSDLRRQVERFPRYPPSDGDEEELDRLWKELQMLQNLGARLGRDIQAIAPKSRAASVKDLRDQTQLTLDTIMDSIAGIIKSWRDSLAEHHETNSETSSTDYQTRLFSPYFTVTHLIAIHRALLQRLPSKGEPYCSDRCLHDYYMCRCASPPSSWCIVAVFYDWIHYSDRSHGLVAEHWARNAPFSSGDHREVSTRPAYSYRPAQFGSEVYCVCSLPRLPLCS